MSKADFYFTLLSNEDGDLTTGQIAFFFLLVYALNVGSFIIHQL